MDWDLKFCFAIYTNEGCLALAGKVCALCGYIEGIEQVLHDIVSSASVMLFRRYVCALLCPPVAPGKQRSISEQLLHFGLYSAEGV